MNRADNLCKMTIKTILENGYIDENPRPHYEDGTPAHTLSVNQMIQTFDISRNEFPLITLRPISWKSAIKEILWIYQDQSNSLDLLKEKYNITWWDDWEVENTKTIGQRYGATIKKYDLMNKLLKELKEDPFGRRHIISLWQEDDFKTPGLNPCAWNEDGKGPSIFDACSAGSATKMRVFYDEVKDDIYLDMTLIQRSSDYLTACSINQIQYIALLMMVARHCEYKSGNFMHVIQNVQIYDRHIENAKIMPYIYNMQEVMETSDLVVSRSGAMTITEISNLAKPAIFIPFPFATENHQEYNARVLEKVGAAKIILDKNLNYKNLNDTIELMVENKEQLKEMGKKAGKIANTNVEENIYNEIRNILSKN